MGTAEALNAEDPLWLAMMEEACDDGVLPFQSAAPEDRHTFIKDALMTDISRFQYQGDAYLVLPTPNGFSRCPISSYACD